MEAEQSDRAGTIFSNPAVLLPGDGSIASRLLGLAAVVLGYLGNALVVIFLGLFVAAQPGAHRAGILRLLSVHHRDTATATLDDMGATLGTLADRAADDDVGHLRRYLGRQG